MENFIDIENWFKDVSKYSSFNFLNDTYFEITDGNYHIFDKEIQLEKINIEIEKIVNELNKENHFISNYFKNKRFNKSKFLSEKTNDVIQIIYLYNDFGLHMPRNISKSEHHNLVLKEFKRIIKADENVLISKLQKRGCLLRFELAKKLEKILIIKDEIINSKDQTINKKEYPNIKFNFTQTELIELIKALIENNNLQGKQKDIIAFFSKVFATEIKYPDKLINDIKNRNVGSETLFLDTLKSTLYNYITKEK